MLRDVYIMKNSKFTPALIDCAAIDYHCHTKYSSEYVQTFITNLIGVRECCTEPDQLLDILLKRGMDFFTAHDHNVIDGALEERRLLWQRGLVDAYGNPKGIINCEYDVPVTEYNPQESNQLIHIGCFGLDYAYGSKHPLPDNEVMALHKRLLEERKKGGLSFICYSLERGLRVVVEHISWQGNPGKRISGKQLEELARDFKKTAEEVSRRKGRKAGIALGIAGDLQLDNLITIEFAEMFDLLLCAGTDAHTDLRAGNQYTIVWKKTKSGIIVPVETSYELLHAFDERCIGMGSRFKPPKIKNLENLTKEEKIQIVKNQFLGTIAELQADTWKGTTQYLDPRAYWNLRKALFLPIVLSTAGTGIPLCLATIKGLPILEKQEVHEMTEETYREIQKNQADKETASKKEKISKLGARIQELQKQMEVSPNKGLEEQIKSLQNEGNQTRREIKETYDHYKEQSRLPDFNKVEGIDWLCSRLMKIYSGRKKPKTISRF